AMGAPAEGERRVGGLWFGTAIANCRWMAARSGGGPSGSVNLGPGPNRTKRSGSVPGGSRREGVERQNRLHRSPHDDCRSRRLGATAVPGFLVAPSPRRVRRQRTSTRGSARRGGAAIEPRGAWGGPRSPGEYPSRRRQRRVWPVLRGDRDRVARAVGSLRGRPARPARRTRAILAIRWSARTRMSVERWRPAATAGEPFGTYFAAGVKRPGLRD